MLRTLPCTYPALPSEISATAARRRKSGKGTSSFLQIGLKGFSLISRLEIGQIDIRPTRLTLSKSLPVCEESYCNRAKDESTGESRVYGRHQLLPQPLE